MLTADIACLLAGRSTAALALNQSTITRSHAIEQGLDCLSTLQDVVRAFVFAITLPGRLPLPHQQPSSLHYVELAPHPTPSLVPTLQVDPSRTRSRINRRTSCRPQEVSQTSVPPTLASHLPESALAGRVVDPVRVPGDRGRARSARGQARASVREGHVDHQVLPDQVQEQVGGQGAAFHWTQDRRLDRRVSADGPD